MRKSGSVSMKYGDEQVAMTQLHYDALNGKATVT